MDLPKEYEIRRQAVWLEAWVNTASSDTCLELHTPTLWADRCLKDFDERFESAKSAAVRGQMDALFESVTRPTEE